MRFSDVEQKYNTERRMWSGFRIYGLSIAVLAMALTGCGRKARPGYEQEAVLQDSPYETLWVEPEIVLADSLVTLIRSDRIDSVLADPTARVSRRRSSIEIRIFGKSCNVAAGLYDSGFRLVHPLLLRHLSTGFYRLTLNVDRFRAPPLPPGTYYLKADFCGEIQLALVTVR